VMLPLAIFFYIGKPEDIGEQVDSGYTPKSAANLISGKISQGIDLTLREAMSSRAYWILVSSWIAWAAIATAITFNLLPIFTELGLSEEAAAGTYSLLMIASAIFQILGGALADRIDLKWLVFGSLGLYSLSVSMLIFLPPVAAITSYILMLGIGNGLFGGLSNTVWVRFFGRTHLGKIRGSVWTASVAGSSIGPFLMGLSYDHFGDFRFSLIVVACVLAALSIAGLWATPPQRREVMAETTRPA
jgi:OFA family oxalate/formate antiporter-like MFS transporter